MATDDTRRPGDPPADPAGNLGSDPTAELDPGSAPRPRPATVSFADGDLVATRYKIVRLLGTGGMGEVYHAQDLLLGEPVALKTIRPDIAAEERMIERFKREIQLARKVTHPNVCRIFDVGLHRPASGQGEIAFLTMELLDGQTLAARLAGGKMTCAEADPLVGQMVAALDAAHRAGVVHRDFKSANVIVVADPAAGSAGRVVVTDFGLARGIGAEASTVTGDGGMVGSPAYMAPEQVEGGAITAATDIYALGVVMYEMVTGQLPFVAESPLATAVKRLREDADPPRQHVPDLEARWNDTIVRALARKPDARFVAVADVAAALGVPLHVSRSSGSFPGSQSLAAMPVRRSRWLWVAAAAGALVLVTIVLTIGAAIGRQRTPPPSPELPSVATRPVAGSRRAIAVLGFKNSTGRADSAWISSAIAEMLSTELTAGGALRVIPGESVARARRELALGDEDSFADDTLAKIGKLLGADYVLSGSYVSMGASDADDLRLDLKLQDTHTGETLLSYPQRSTAVHLVNLVSETGKVVRDKLAVANPSPTEITEIHAAMPANADIARLYAEGLDQLRVEACSAARAPLEQAVAADPSFALAHSALAEALSCLGYDERALAEANRAVELSANLPAHIRLAAQARVYSQSRDFTHAIEAYQKLFQDFPDNFDYGILLAETQLHYLRPEDAQVTLAALRKLPSPAGDNPRIDVAAAWAMVESNQIQAGIDLAEMARQRAEAQGARLVEADAYYVKARGYTALGKSDDALAALAQAKAIFEAANDKAGQAQVLSLEAQLKQKSGDVDAVRKLEEQVAGIAEQLGSATWLLNMRLSIGAALSARGDLDGARHVYEEVAETAAARKQPIYQASALFYLAAIQLSQADLVGCLATAERATSLHADENLERAVRILGSTAALYSGDVKQAQALLDSAATGAGGLLLDNIDVERAWFYGETGELERGVKLVREVIARSSTAQPLARAVLARLLLEQGKARDALAILPDEQTFLYAGPDFEHLIAPTSARARAAIGDKAAVAKAEDDMRALDARSRKSGRILMSLDARLALARIQIEHGQVAEGRKLLAEVEEDANDHGVKLLAHHARLLLDRK